MSGSKRINNTIKSTRKTFQVIVGLVILLVAVGVIVFQQIEGWHLIDSLYFVSATLTTIGYGDVAPVTTLGKLFAIVYMWIGVTLAAAAIGLVGSVILHKKKRFK